MRITSFPGLVRLSALLLAALLLVGASSAARAQGETNLAGAAQRLDQTRAAIEQIESTLAKPDLPDSLLKSLRAQLDPISAEIVGVIGAVTPRVEAIRSRIAQLGPKPGDKDAPETATVSAERVEQEKALAESQELLKRARLAMVQADQAVASIASRRRAAFTRALFARSDTPIGASLWITALREAPRETAAFGAILSDWAAQAARRLPGWRTPAFLGFILGLLLAYWPVSRMARRVIWRDPQVEAPTRLRKALAALWVAAVVASLPIAAATAISGALDWLDLATPKIAPVLAAMVEGVARVAVVAGLARGLLAARRPNWRLPDLSTPAAATLARMAVGLAMAVSLTRLGEAVNDAVAASLTFSVATRSLGALAAAAVMASALWTIGAGSDADETASPAAGQIGGAMRFLAWSAIAVIIGAAASGYVALASFLVAQLVWLGVLGAMLHLLGVAVEEGAASLFKPTAFVGRALTTSLGARRDALERWSVLAAGVLRVALYAAAAMLALAPWGVQSDDVFGNLRAAFFGFKVGDVTVSLSTIAAALTIFAGVYAATRAVQRWLETKYLPQTQMDAGLRNSIDTIVGYLGFVLAAALALAHVGLSFEKLAIVAGALSVGIGFGLQSVVNNFVSGLILLGERAVRVGDWIVVGDQQGFVRRINVRSTEIETFDRSTVIVPNSNLVTGVVKNWVRTDRVGRLKIPLIVNHLADPEAVRDLLIGAARTHDLVMKLPAPQVQFTGMEPSGLSFDLLCFVQDVETSARVKSDLNFDIFRRLKEAGVSIPAASSPPVIHITGLDRLEALLKPTGPDPSDPS
jgi:small-conductance mechanosensitive channel